MERQGTVSVFKKLYFLFGIIILVVYISIIAISVRNAAQRRSEEIDFMSDAVRYNLEDLKQQLDIIYNQERNLVTDTRLSSLVSDTGLSEYESSMVMRNLIASAVSIQSMNRSVGEVKISFPKLGVELNSNGNYLRKEYVAKDRKERTTSRYLIYEEGMLQMELLYPLTFSTDENYVPDYGICTTVSEEYLQGIVDYFSDGEKSGAFFVVNDGTELLPGSGGEEVEKIREKWYEAWKKDGGADSFRDTIRCRGTGFFLMSGNLPAYGLTLVVYRNSAGIANAMMVGLLGMALVLLVLSVLFFYILRQTSNAVQKPLEKLMEAFDEVQGGNLEIRIFHREQDEFQHLYTSFNRTVERIQELLENVREQGKLLQNAELIQLQSQINPHFLYNSFYLIRIMAKNESFEQIDTFVTSLAKYYRFLNKEVEQNIELAREAEHMENYINIQQMRFGDKITVTLAEMPQEIRNWKVPKLILQPVVENAYNYGMKDVIADGKIMISYLVEGNKASIIIEDSGSGSLGNLEQIRENIRDYKGRAAGHALSNIERRLKLAYGEDCGLLLEHSGLGGLKVSVRLRRDGIS